MIHRSSSSRRRKTPRASAGSPHRSTGSLVRKASSGNFESAAGPYDKNADREDKRDRKLDDSEVSASSSRIRGGSSSNISDYPSSLRSSSITVTAAAEDHNTSFYSTYQSGRETGFEDNAISLNEYPQKGTRGSIGYEYRPVRKSVTPDDLYGVRSLPSAESMGRKCRSSLLPEASKSPRSSLVPEEAYNRSPRGSIDPSLLSRGSRNSLCPDPEVYNRSSRPSMVADVTALRNSRNSLLPDVHTSPNRSPRNSLIPSEGNRSPRGSLVPECSRSPRNSLVPDTNRTPRGSLVADMPNRTPRGSVTSEGSMYSYNRSSRSSLPLQDSCVLGKSPRGSIASASGVQFDLPARTPRGSVESVPPGISRISAGSQRSTSPFHSGSLRGNQSASAIPSAVEATDGSRRASSNVSQVGVSADDRRHLCEHTKLNPEAGLRLTAYGSFVYQLNHANMESSGTLDFVLRVITIVYRTAIVTVLLVCLTMLPLIMLIMGLEFIRDCPKEPHIPVYMIVGGCFGLMKILWVLWGQIRSLRYERLNPRDTGRSDDDMLATSVGTKIGCFALTAFLISWFVFGNYWILHIYWPDHDSTLFKPNNWCHRTLYVFSVVHLVIIYSIVAVVLLAIIVMATIQICLLRCR